MAIAAAGKSRKALVHSSHRTHTPASTGERMQGSVSYRQVHRNRGTLHAGRSRYERNPRLLPEVGSWGMMQEQINKMLRMPFGSLMAAGVEVRLPQVDVTEDTKNVYVDADIPGMEQKDIHLSVEHGFLVMTGLREVVKEEKHKNVYRSERVQGSFTRELYLPSPVDAARITATYRQGVLHVILPKKNEPKGREIKVE